MRGQIRYMAQSDPPPHKLQYKLGQDFLDRQYTETLMDYYYDSVKKEKKSAAIEKQYDINNFK